MDQMAVAAALRATRRAPSAAAMLRQRRLNRAIATVNQAAQLQRAGGRRLLATTAATRKSRLDLAQSLFKENLVRARGRSLSRGRLQAAAPQSNLRRSNSRLNLQQGNAQMQMQQQQPRRRLNRDFQQRARSRSQSRARSQSRSRQTKAPSIASRLGVRPAAANQGNAVAAGRRSRSRQRANSVSGAGKPSVLSRISQGRVSKQQRLGNRPNAVAGKNKRNRGGVNQNQIQNAAKKRLGGAKAMVNQKKKKSGNNGNLQQRLIKAGNRGQQKQQQQQRNQKQNQAQGKGRPGKRGKAAAAGNKPRGPIKKEDLDKELDRYMSTSKPSLY